MNTAKNLSLRETAAPFIDAPATLLPRARMKRIFSVLKSFLVFRYSEWDKHAVRQSVLLGIIFICAVVTMATFDDWWHGMAPLWKPILWALPVVVLFMATSEKRLLACVTLGIFAFYGVRGILFFQDPFGYWVTGVSVLLIVLLLATVPRQTGTQ